MLERLIKVGVLLAMGVFLFTRITGDTILFYINNRFIALTALAAGGFLILGAGYWFAATRGTDEMRGTAFGRVSLAGLLLVALPIILGVFITPRPLGAAALSNREVSLESLTTVSVTESSASLRPTDRNVLDWLVEFQRADEPDAFTGQEARVVGFVYRDSRFDDNSFMVGRFIVSCCVADADPIGLIVRAPDASEYPDDQWLEIRGRFEMGNFDGEETPILAADEITPVDPPIQPYLYP